LLNHSSTPRGFPCCVRFPGVHAVATTPAQRLGASSARFPSRISLPGKGVPVGPRIGIFEVCSAFIHITACTLVGSPKVIRCIEGFSHFVTSMTAPTTSGWSIFAGWDLHPLESAAFSRRTPQHAGRHRLLRGNCTRNRANRRRHLFTLKSVIANPSSLSAFSSFVALHRVGKPYLGSYVISRSTFVGGSKTQRRIRSNSASIELGTSTSMALPLVPVGQCPVPWMTRVCADFPESTLTLISAPSQNAEITPPSWSWYVKEYAVMTWDRQRAVAASKSIFASADTIVERESEANRATVERIRCLAITLSDAGYRLFPWLNEDNTRDRSSRLLDVTGSVGQELAITSHAGAAGQRDLDATRS
jgi:hypothetical protein